MRLGAWIHTDCQASFCSVLCHYQLLTEEATSKKIMTFGFRFNRPIFQDYSKLGQVVQKPPTENLQNCRLQKRDLLEAGCFFCRQPTVGVNALKGSTKENNN